MGTDTKRIDVLILGGGTAGTAAAWQARQMGVSVLIAEPSPWIGGMITAAGVSAFDGNKGTLASGFYRRLRDHLEQYYGGKEAVFTGWISETCFEPHVAERFLREELADAGTEIWHRTELVRVLREGDRITGAILRHRGEEKTVRAAITIDATEYGDGLASADIPFRFGRDSREELGEEHAPEQHDDEIQDMTVCAILKRFPGRAPAVEKPEGYDPRLFDCAVSEYCTIPDEEFLNHKLHDWDSFLTYSLLPNDKYLLNWPHHSNDYPDTVAVFRSAGERAEALRRARLHTLAFVHFMQTELGHPEWGIATDEFDTPDGLAYIPYMRESRRTVGIRTMVESDVVPILDNVRPSLQPDAIAIGDYFLDHHHSKAFLPPGERLVENYPNNAPFQIPYGCLIPESVDGFLAAEKNISVSHIVNGCTRLQPVVMLTGQAAGAAAAMAIQSGIEPRELSVRRLQNRLIGDGVMLYPMRDVDCTDPYFTAVQQIALRGVLPDDDPLEFKPDRAIDIEEAVAWTRRLGVDQSILNSKWEDGLTRAQWAEALNSLLDKE